LPLGLHLVQRGLSHRTSPCLDGAFHGIEPAHELLVGATERGLGFDAELARQVGDGE
jgi:hypothetical protein